MDVVALRMFLESVGSATNEFIFLKGVQPTIYHYTDLNGLAGILRDDDIWLTNSRYSNDDEELTHGYNLVRRILEEELAKVGVGPRKDFLDQTRVLLEQPAPEGVYICCFCNDGDVLSQWRAYGGNGTGVSIGFEPMRFNYITGADSPPGGLVRLWPVIYEVTRQENIVRRALEFEDGLPPESRSKRMADAITFFIPTFKNADFAGENEVRLIFSPDAQFGSQPDFRVARAMLVPYYSVKKLMGVVPNQSASLPITSVRIGPTRNKEENRRSVEMLLRKSGYLNVSVDASSTPYRG
jgi:hypothetical protein